MYTTNTMGLLKAKIAAEMQEFHRISSKLADLQTELQEQCEDFYGHDYGPDEQDLFCNKCDKMNDQVYAEAEEDMFSIEIERKR